MRRVPCNPEGWLREIAEAYRDALDALPFMELVGENAEEVALWTIAPLVALKFRELPFLELNREKATNAAFASYVANEERNPAELGDAHLAFAFSYLASHYGLDLVPSRTVDEVMEHVGRHHERLRRMVSESPETPSRKMKKKSRRKARRVAAGAVSVTGEVAYIVGRAQHRESCVVSYGPLLFFSSQAGDAWVLDPADGLALCLARDGEAQAAEITETQERFAVRWNASYQIKGQAFVVADEDGRMRTILGYPVTAIARASAAATGE